jgi:hypothetical protein
VAVKSTRRFLRSKRYLNTYFACMWTVAIGEDGKRIGKMKRRYIKCEPRWRGILMQLDRMRCPLRIKP